MEKERPVVFIVDDDEAVCESLRLLVEDIGLEATTFSSALQFLSAYEPGAGGCLLLDLRMPGMSGLELLSKLRERGDDLPVIVITGHADVPTAVAAMKAGALDLFEKPFRHEPLLYRVQEAIALAAQRRHRHQEQRDIQARLGLLTAREREILAHLITGKTNKNVAYELGISQKTVDFHRTNILDKVGVQSLIELVHLVRQGEPSLPGHWWTPVPDDPAKLLLHGRPSRPPQSLPAMTSTTECYWD